jgi:8-oxo-dGTP pyrophosphatase MutT (NUDIX family)
VVTQWPAYDVERTSVRVVLVDTEGRVLLFHTSDPTMPEIGEWWELPGGGMEDGESYAETAAREITEETGFVLAPGEFGPPTWRRDSTYVRRHVRYWQHEVVVTARVADAAPEPGAEGRTPTELEEYDAHRWWTVEELEQSAERFFPTPLPAMVRRFLGGDEIDEPFDLWN